MKALLALAVMLAVLSLLLGAAGFGVPDATIVWQLRVPRTGLALLVGAGLGLSGAVLQGVLRNPLADPGFLGVGGCAALGAVIVYYWGVSAAFAPALPLGGLAGAAVGCGALLLIFARAQSGPGLVLAGVGVSAIAAALLSLVLSAAPNPFALYEITFWLMGGLEDRTLTHLALAALPIALGCAVLLRLGPGLDALSLGEDVATSLGAPAGRTLTLAVVGVSLAVGAGAAVAGGIGFVGLVVPHLLRPWCGARPGALLAPSLVLGGVLLLAADCLARAGGVVAADCGGAKAGCADGAAGRAISGGDRAKGGAVIGVSGLSVSLGGRPVLRDVSFAAGAGELVALVGPNGAGKTTLLRALAGVLPGAPARPDPRRVAYLPQGARCAWGLTVRQVAALGRLPFGGRDEGQVEAALRRCGVLDLADRRIDQVSGGQARRAMLARALAGEPHVLLLDEPVADLDPPACHAVMRLLRDFAAGGGAVVTVLHALELAVAYAGRMVVLAEGAVVADGAPGVVGPQAAAVFGMAWRDGHVPLLACLKS